jgi:hypothetical protein
VYSYKYFVDAVRAWTTQQDKFSVTEHIADYNLPEYSGVWLWTFLAPGAFSQLMICREPGHPDEATIRIGGGAAVRIPINAAVHQYVAAHAYEYSEGAFFARYEDEGNTIGVAVRLNLHGRVLDANAAGAGFVVAMTRILGEEGRDMGQALVRNFGGRLLDGTQESDPQNLTALAGLL